VTGGPVLRSDGAAATAQEQVFWLVAGFRP